VDDLRQVQCVRDACRVVVFFCSPCDHGQIYCSPECGDLQRAVARRASKQRYWQSFDGRWATARRMRELRAVRRQIVTDTGEQRQAS